MGKKPPALSQRYVDKLEALGQFTKELIAIHEPELLLPFIVEKAMQLTNADAGGIYLHRPEWDVLEWVVGVGDIKDPKDAMVSRGNGVAGKAWLLGEPLVIATKPDAETADGEPGTRKGEACIGIPIKRENEFLGVLKLCSYKPRASFKNRDVTLLTQFAVQAALAIQNVRIHDRERRRTSQLATVADVAEKITSILNVDELLQESVRLIQKSFGYYWVSIMLYDAETDELVFKTGAGGYNGLTPSGFRQKNKEGMIGWVQFYGEALLANDISREPRYIPAYLARTKSELDVPLKYHGKVIGVLDIQSRDLNTFSQHDVMAMEALAGQLATAIANARLYGQLQQELAERTRAEEALQRSEKDYRGLFENAFDAIIIFDPPEWHVLDVNQHACQVYGLRREEFAGLRLADIVKDADAGSVPFRETLEKGIPHTFEAIQYRRDGTEIWLEINASVIHYHGKPALMSINRDITDRKNSEMQLKRYAQELKESNASKDKFFSIIAHDLQGPFHGFLTVSDILVNKVDSLAKEEIIHFSKEMNKALRSQWALLKDLLEWSRIQTGRITYSPQRHDIRALVSEAVQHMDGFAASKNISVNNLIKENTLACCDRMMISSVLNNLLSNAVKFTHPGGHVSVSAEETERKVIVSVADDGVGISEIEITKVFRIDSRHYSTEGTAGETGTGLGLIICKEMVEKNGGKIWVCRRPEHGTEFFFSLPRE